MKKLGYVLRLSARRDCAPSIASAETVVIKRGHHDGYSARAEYREHHRGLATADAIATPTSGDHQALQSPLLRGAEKWLREGPFLFAPSQ
jgi:hypothetical protein